MQRHTSTPRRDWQERVESQGLRFHSPDGEAYWDESAYYSFHAAEIDQLERASYLLQDLCLKAVQHVIDEERWEPFRVAPHFVDFIEQSWQRDELTVYGRFDLAYDGRSPPKLLEYNADTPTALLEAAVVQWHWLKDTRPDADQFNSIHERLIEFWPRLGPATQGPIHFCSQRDHLEDLTTVTYLRDTAVQAGFETEYMAVEDIGWNRLRNAFVDGHEWPLRTVFKLYPWEWMLREEFGAHLLGSRIRWLEPAWKVLLSNKAILAVLWELFPECPHLLPTFFEPRSDSYVRKPVQGREGANIQVVSNGQVSFETDGDYAEEPVVYQSLYPFPRFDGNTAVLGSWMVNGYACGLGIREDVRPVTGNGSRFVPHLFTP